MSEESATSVAVLGRKAGLVVRVYEPGLSMRNGGTVHNTWSSDTQLAEAAAMRKGVFIINSCNVA